MLINSIIILCVRVCPQDCIRDGTRMKKHKNSGQGKIEFERLKIRSCHNFKQPNLNANLRVTKLQEHRKKIDCFSVDGYCNHCKTVFRSYGLLFPFLPLSRSFTKPN